MSGEIGSMRPNPYIFDIENRKKRKPRLAHDLGAGAKCNKCGDKCPGFELHFWRKICMNCRCGKDDHEVEDDDEDIGQVVIGKLFDRPARTEKEELEYCYGNSLEMLNEETGKAENVKFDWVPPNVEKTLASRYMELLPPEKRPVAGSEAAKARRRQLEQQVPLYDMDAAQRSDSLPPEELQNFLAYLERIRTQVAGQGSVQEIVGAPAPSYAQPLQWQSTPGSVGAGFGVGDLDANGNIGYYPDTQAEMGMTGRGSLDQANIQNNNVGIDGTTQNINNDPLSPTEPRRGSTQLPSLRQQFLGGMVGEPAGITNFKAEDPAFSSPYGGTRMTAKPIQGFRNDRSVEGISAGLSDLSVQNRMPENAPGQRPAVPGLPPTQASSFSQTEQNRNDPSQMPFSGTPKGYRPVRPSHLQQQQGTQTNVPGDGGYQTNQPGYQPGMPGFQQEQPGKPGYQSHQAGLPGNTAYQPGQTGFQPTSPPHHSGHPPGQPGIPGYQPEQLDKTGYQPDQPGYQSGHPSTTSPLPGQPGYQSEQPGSQQQQQLGYSPKKPGYQPGQLGCQPRQPGQPGYDQGQGNYQPGTPGYLDNQEGSQPGNLGYQSNQPEDLGLQLNQFGQPAYSPGHPNQSMQSPSDYQSVDQEFPPPPLELLAFTPQTGSDAASIDSGVEIYDNLGAKLRAKIDEEGKNTPLLQMLAKERNIAAVEAMQAPYGAQIDTLTGGMSIAPGSEVNVLFPGESQIIGSKAKNSSVREHKSKYTCQGCSHPMSVGDVAIFCERAGEDKCWHPACFSCYTCKELLADLIYFYKDGKVFCGRHFTESEEMPRCKSCDELIFGNSWTRADGFDWHINHFCCNVCDTPMAGQRYVPDQNGYPYCLPCYMSYVAKMCEGCEEKISPEVNRCGHRGYFYHATPQCFKCYSCQDTLLGKRFKMSKNWVFCSNECIQNAAEDLDSNPNPKIKEEV